VRHHPNGGDVLFQLGLGLADVAVEELPDVAKLCGHESADAPYLSRNRIRFGGEKLACDVVKLLLAGGDLYHQRWGRAAKGGSGSQIPNLMLELFCPVTHPSQLAIQTRKRRFQLVLKSLNCVLDDVRPKHLSL
jgi:hypothetical protein